MSLKKGEIESLISTKTLPNIKISKHKLWDNPDPPQPDKHIDDKIELLLISPDEVVKYKYKDRPENEFGDLEEFARVLKKVGQLQPGIVRLSTIPGFKYELIVGERRWRACKLAGIPFKAQLINYTDNEAGLAQAIENKERESLSDYAKGINYALQIADGVLSQSDLAEKLGTTRQQISRLMSYKEIPNELITAIGDMTKVSPRTAEEIKFICKKDKEGLSILLSLSDKLRSGIGHTALAKNYDQLKNTNEKTLNIKKAFSAEGRHLFSWRKDGNGSLAISFPKDIRKLIDIDKAETVFINTIETIIKSNPEEEKKTEMNE